MKNPRSLRQGAARIPLAFWQTRRCPDYQNDPRGRLSGRAEGESGSAANQSGDASPQRKKERKKEAHAE